MNERQTNSGDRDNTGAASLSDETIRRFLLCRLSDDERAQVEERLFVDDVMEERVRLAECELTDDFAFNRLSAEEREFFVKKFIVTNARRQKLAVSQALQSHFSSPPVNAKENVAAIEPGLGWRERFLGLFDFKRPALSFAASLAALILVAGVIWIVSRNLRESGEPVIARLDPSPAPTPQTSPQIVTSPTPNVDPNPTPNPTPKLTPTPVAPPPPRAAVASFVLLPGALRDGGEMSRVTLPKGARDTVRLQLALEANEPGAYRAELLTAEGKPVMTSRGLKASGATSGAKIVFDVPARSLQVGDYQVKLSRNTAGGSIEVVGRYYFRALSQ